MFLIQLILNLDLGVWWIAHQTNTGNFELDSHYSVKLSEFVLDYKINDDKDNDDSNAKYLIRNKWTLSPGSNPFQSVPSWHQVPENWLSNYLGLHEEEGNETELVEQFIDYLFYPGRLSYFAIWNAFKVNFSKY